MNSKRLIQSRAHRILRHLSRYHPKLPQNGRVPSCMRGKAFFEGEKVLGVYENTPDNCDESLIITTLGIYLVQDQSWRLLPYHEMIKVEIPSKEDKHEVQFLLAHLTSGETVQMPVKGGTAKWRDAWEFLRFLTRVMSDIRQDGKDFESKDAFFSFPSLIRVSEHSSLNSKNGYGADDAVPHALAVGQIQIIKGQITHLIEDAKIDQ